METKRNLKYFTAPPISVPSLIGWIITIVGAILFFLPYVPYLYSIIVLIVGALVICVYIRR